ncbi:hypothetical protein OSC52_16250 [Clostridium pasteurianum]|uniref:anti-sigma-I factor RsgI family protein n=1 Tax=Clostridium pasteurianum TaxID=1501 RepID=UPI002260B023|nr:hypothetical protein [Clostridium pasteurianum]UZW13382.1 hypothetical protein OSC52_16250 [Clostridium pasteurianum]
MITRFKSALNQIKVEDQLISKTKVYLKDSLTKNEDSKINKFIKHRLLPMKRKLAIAAWCLAFLLTIGGISGVYGYYQTSVAYISLDINPSVELGINNFGRVVKAEGYNNEGNKILNGINVKGSDVTTAIDTLVTTAIENGYIAKDGSSVISLTSETDDKNTATNIETEAETGAKEALITSGKKAEILKDNVSLTRRNEARKLGITPGKLNLIQKLQRVDKTATVDKYKDAAVKDIMKAIQNSVDNTKVSDAAAESKKETTDKDNTVNTTNYNLNNNDKGNVGNKTSNINRDNAANTTESVKNNNVNNSKGIVESKTQNIDIGNRDNNTKTVKNNNISNNGAVKDKKQTIDKSNNVNTKKSVKNNNVNNGNGKNNNKGNNGNKGNGKSK